MNHCKTRTPCIICSHYLDMLFGYFIYYLWSISICCSIYMTMVLAFERYQAITRHESTKPWRKILSVYICPVVLFSMVYRIPKLFEVKVLSFTFTDTFNEMVSLDRKDLDFKMKQHFFYYRMRLCIH